MDGHAQIHFENRYTRQDGRVAHIMWSARWSATDQLRVAVARDITTLKQTQAKQAALYAISEAAHATEELPALLQRIHQIVCELLPACGLTVSLRDEHGQHLHHAHAADWTARPQRTPRWRACCAKKCSAAAAPC